MEYTGNCALCGGRIYDDECERMIDLCGGIIEICPACSPGMFEIEAA